MSDNEATPYGVNRAVLVVEDDADMARVLGRVVRDMEYSATLCDSAEEALDLLGEAEPTALLVDIGLPGRDGIWLVRHLRDAGYHAPILIVTVFADAATELAGLSAGADDYVAKPFDVRVLRARLARAIDRCASPGIMHCGPVTIDRFTGRTCVSGKELNLTPIDSRLLRFFATRPNRVVSVSDLARNVWTHRHLRERRSYQIAVQRLRQKLETAGVGGTLQTVRGQGYLFCLNPEGVGPGKGPGKLNCVAIQHSPSSQRLGSAATDDSDSATARLYTDLQP